MMYAFGVGALAGFVCIAGLYIGLSLLISTMEQDQAGTIEKSQRNKRYAMASVALVGQLLGALYVLFKIPVEKSQSMPLGLGLVSVIFVGALTAQLMQKKN